MLLPFVLLAAQLAADAPHLQPAPPAETEPPATQSRPLTVPQAKAAMVASFNELVAAMHDFSTFYNGSHTINARKAARVRKAWAAFESAEHEYDALREQR